MRHGTRLIAGGVLALVVCLGAACAGQKDTPGDANAPDTPSALFATADSCSGCHDNLTDAADRDISFVNAWSTSVHSYASVDPYYLATVSHESELLPDSADVVQTTCATCHLPMANITAQETGASGAFLGEGASSADSSLHALYRDAVSCLVCHQIAPEGLDTDAAASGGFKIDTTTSGLRTLYGQFALSDAMQTVMENAIGYTSVQSDHVASSELCATCHTLYTQPIGTDGALMDIAFPEQVPYLEWQQSSLAQTSSCQSCHMPSSASTMISTLSEETRDAARIHSFTGGNVFLLNLMAADADADAAAAASNGIASTTELLETQTASLTVTAERSGDVITVTVTVNNLAGHKLPTAFPSRRAWLHVTATGEFDGTLINSGSWESDGSIVGNNNDDDAAAFEPHYTAISANDQVQIYESILGDSSGGVTTSVMAATGYLKDNRLLPLGFDKAAALADTAVAGEALADADFTGGQDTVTYRFPAPHADGYPVVVTVELLYQPVGYRWLENLRGVGTQESDALFASANANTSAIAPVAIAVREVQVP